MAQQLQTYLASGVTSFWLLGIGIVLLSYLLEDLAIATAAVLSVQGNLPPAFALLAIFIGIATGDLGLYLLGQYGRKVRWLRYRALTNSSFKLVQKKLHHNAFLNLFIIRFIPGLRTVGFTLSGFFSIPLPLFFSAVLLATSLWTLTVFSLIYFLGVSVFEQVSGYKWLLIPVALFALYVFNRLINEFFKRGVS